MKAALISPFSMAGGGSTRLCDLVKNTDLDWVLILPEKDKYGDSPQDSRVFHPVKHKSMLNLPFWCLRTLRFLKEFKPDVVHALKPHPYTVLPSVIYCKVSGCRLVYDCDEWDPLTLSDNQRNMVEVGASKILITLALHASDAILYANHRLFEERMPKKLQLKCFYVPNGVDLDLFSPQKKEHEGFIVGFVGLIHKIRHIEPLIRAIDFVKHRIPYVKAKIIGAGPALEEFKQKVAGEGLSGYFLFEGYVEHEKIPEYLADCDVLIAPFRNLPGVSYQCNMKLFEYMGLGKPIIATDVGDIPRLLSDAGYV
ncbi:MAG: glycosyltransferase, partial [Candidatus Altiarchaeales archaeon]|nr:glycosyltransferase [Candidatus Altiarchaeales archaeon]